MTQHWRETVIEMVEEEWHHEEIKKKEEGEEKEEKEEKEEGEKKEEEKEEKEGSKVVEASSGGKSELENDSMEATVQRVGDEMQCIAGNACQGAGKRGRFEGEVAIGAEVL